MLWIILRSVVFVMKDDSDIPYRKNRYQYSSDRYLEL